MHCSYCICMAFSHIKHSFRWLAKTCKLWKFPRRKLSRERKIIRTRFKIIFKTFIKHFTFILYFRSRTSGIPWKAPRIARKMLWWTSRGWTFGLTRSRRICSAKRWRSNMSPTTSTKPLTTCSKWFSKSQSFVLNWWIKIKYVSINFSFRRECEIRYAFKHENWDLIFVRCCLIQYETLDSFRSFNIRTVFKHSSINNQHKHRSLKHYRYRNTEQLKHSAQVVQFYLHCEYIVDTRVHVDQSLLSALKHF